MQKRCITFCLTRNPVMNKMIYLRTSFTVTTPIVYTSQFVVSQKKYSYHTSLMDSLINETQVEVFQGMVIKDGSLQNSYVCNNLLNLYVKFQNNVRAHKLFEEIPYKDVHTWTAFISSISRSGSSILVLELFREMQSQRVCPNQFTLSIALKNISRLRETRVGKGIHGWIIRNRIDLDVVLENSILDFYVKCKALIYGERFFRLMNKKDSVSLNIMLAACLHSGQVEKSLELFKSSSYNDVASWNTVIDGLMRNGFEVTALGLLYQMVESGPMLNKVTFSIALVLVSHMSVLELGKQLHVRILRLGIHVDGFVKNSLINMYCKCGKMRMASVIFDKGPSSTVSPEKFKICCNQSMSETVSLCSLVSGHVQNGDYEEALKTYISMVHEQHKSDKYTLTSIISACANSGNLEFGRQVHAHIQKSGYSIDAHLGSALIDMYAKCGRLCDAQMIFEKANDFNVVLWTSMISGCALHGHVKESIDLFECMVNKGIAPNEVTFVGVLTACSHGGLVEDGHKYYRLMKEVYGISPGVEHITCMVDIYGRAGLLKEAKEFIDENSISNMSAVLRSILSSCLVHKDMEMGKWVAERLLELEPLDGGPYILLSNMYTTEHRWEEASELRSLMWKRGLKKYPGQSLIHLKI